MMFRFSRELSFDSAFRNDCERSAAEDWATSEDVELYYRAQVMKARVKRNRK